MNIRDATLVLFDEYSAGYLFKFDTTGDLMREIYEYLGYSKTMCCETSAYIHDTLKEKLGEKSEIFNWFRAIVRRCELNPIKDQSYCESLKDVIIFRSKTHELILIITPYPELYQNINEIIPMKPEQFKEYIIMADSDYQTFLKQNYN